jgi:hypothetical protein
MRLIDADSLIAEWYKLNNIGPEDCGARFVGYQEIARLINNAPTVSGQGDYISRADAIEAVCGLSVLVDDEDFYYFEDALKALPSADAKWIPCSDRLPKAEDMYQPPEQRYLCQLEAYGERKFCVLSRLKGAVSPFWDWYGVAVYDSEVTAWMPLPTPYKGGDDE